MDFFHELTRKPWLPEPDGVTEIHGGRAYALPVEKVALRLFLAVVTVLFSLTVVVYSDRMYFSDWHPIPEPWLLWFNTAMLMTASVTFHHALTSARRGSLDGVRRGLYAAGLCTLVFLAGQIWVARELIGMGFYADTHPAAAFFYLLTTMHALHLAGGLVAWLRTAGRMWRGDGAAELTGSVELCAVYWHYLLVLWLVLFSLLLFT